MYFAPAACLRRKASISSSPTMSLVPAPPGMQITSSCGHSANVVVGVSAITESVGTGSMRFQIRCTLAPGTAENTCSGPVKSSWVTFGKMSSPICRGSDIGSLQIALDGTTMAWWPLVQNGVIPSFSDAAATSEDLALRGFGDDRHPDLSRLPAARCGRPDRGVRDRGALRQQ